ncbi:MAG TPA: redoxin domain-containing protein [Chryseosolibacter sp.]|nr:redoxin domain-containing protein [Chryseosolibacter sp.]
MKRWLIFSFLSLVTVQAFTQELTKFELTNVLNNQTISLETYPSCEGLVIIFTSNDCPYDDYYRNRIEKLAETYNDRVPVLLVNSNTDPAESNENMVKEAKQSGITVPYLADKDQTLMTTLEARKSPEAFLLRNNGGKFTVVYHGAIDDNPQVEADVRKSYLRDAIDIMLSKQQVATPEVRPVGCSLKKKN